MPRSRCSALRNTCISWRSFRSSAPSGSSRSSTDGELTIARASATRCRCPPESCTRLARADLGRRTRSSTSCAFARRSRRPTPFTRRPYSTLSCDAHVREERVVLEDGVDVALERRHARHVDAGELDVPLVRLLEAGDHAQGRRLPGARRAEHREELAFGDVEVEPVDRNDVAVRAADAAQPHRGARRVALFCSSSRSLRRQALPPGSPSPRSSSSSVAESGGSSRITLP